MVPDHKTVTAGVETAFDLGLDLLFSKDPFIKAIIRTILDPGPHRTIQRPKPANGTSGALEDDFVGMGNRYLIAGDTAGEGGWVQHRTQHI
jgi:hypothetical protein